MNALQPFPILPPPGVVATESVLAAQGRWTLPWQWFRFVKGRFQKIGGWALAAATATSGMPRTIHAWRDLGANQYLAAGTYRKLYVYDTILAQNDITPYRATGTLGADPFTTTLGSATVSVTHVGHGLSAGDTVIYTGSAAVGGITPNGTFVVVLVTSANAYTFTFTSAATGAAVGGGAAVAYSYEIPIGTELGTTGLGYGVGGYGLGTYGTERSSSTIVFEARVWSLDHFGKILLASYNGGSVYTFDPSLAQPWGRAAIIADAPTDCRAMLVTPEEYVFALREAMVVSWCTQGDYTIWTPATGNTANSRTLTVGTKLVGGKILAEFQTLIWSDSALYMFQWTGDTYVYRSSMVGKDCGLLGPNAAVTVAGIAYWMGTDNFFMFSGSVQVMPNVEDVRKYVFDDSTGIDQQYGYQAAAFYNPRYNEIWFQYTILGQTSPTKLVIYHIGDQCWSTHAFTRVSGTHFTQGDTRPYMGDSSGYIYQHENTMNGAGSAITCTATMAPVALQEGLSSMDVESMLCDTFEQNGDISWTLNGYDRVKDTDSTAIDTRTVTVDDDTAELSDFRISGRYVGQSIVISAVDGYFRYGKPVAFVKPSGRRS